MPTASAFRCELSFLQVRISERRNLGPHRPDWAGQPHPRMPRSSWGPRVSPLDEMRFWEEGSGTERDFPLRRLCRPRREERGPAHKSIRRVLQTPPSLCTALPGPHKAVPPPQGPFPSRPHTPCHRAWSPAMPLHTASPESSAPASPGSRGHTLDGTHTRALQSQAGWRPA